MRPNTSVLQQLIPLADAHQAAGEYRAGHYWRGNGHGAGCAVGCTIHDAKAVGVIHADVDASDHAAIAAATGMPEMVWRLADAIFEGLPVSARPAWTPRLLRAAEACRDATRVPAAIMARLADRLADVAIRDDVREASRLTAGLWRRRAAGDEPQKIEWDAAMKQAFAAWQHVPAWEQAHAAWQHVPAWEQAHAAWQQAHAAWQQAHAAWQQSYVARQQADAAMDRANAAWQQARAAMDRAGAEREQARAAMDRAGAAWEQAHAAREQANAARKQAFAAWQQAFAAWEQFWVWCADMVCRELEGV